MTIEGAIVDLQKLIDDDAIPFWAKPSLKKIKETVEDEREEHLWIPVTERLPEEETDVLVCNKDGKIELTCGSRSTEVDGFIWYTSGWKFGDVIAWMPLPKPYKEGADNE